MDPVQRPSPLQVGTIRPARLTDVAEVHQLIEAFAQRQLLLSRSRGELFETIRDFLVAVDDQDRVHGCAAVHVINGQIAELKSLAVAAAAQGRGLGRQLVAACIEAAQALGLETLFCLTYQVDFFSSCGFAVVDRARLPEKVWGECVRCNKFLDCDEVAMWRHLGRLRPTEHRTPPAAQ